VWQSISVKDSLDLVKDWLTIEQVAELLGIPKGKVNRLLEDYSLVAVNLDGKLMIPAALIVSGEPLAPLRGTIIMLLDSGYSIEESVTWLFTFSEVLQQTPVQSLIEGKKSPVRRLAQMLDI
jgi:excisionase family DNA binding protein